MADDDRDEIVRFIVTFGLADTLLVIHRDDRTGHCQVCAGGPQAGRTVWPCTLRVYAEKTRSVAPARGGQFGLIMSRSVQGSDPAHAR